MTPISPTCRLCNGDRLSSLGTIPASDYFAGKVIERPIPAGKLWRCDACGSMLRHPVLTSDDYTKLYEEGASDAWCADDSRNDLRVIRAYILQRQGRLSVLDVGCGNGGFLHSLPLSVQKFGIELSTAAAAAARRAGIYIAGRTFEDLKPSAQFEVITIIDVIEHLPDPLKLLDQAVTHLAPGGSIIVSTGDPSFMLWRRLFRSRFWYSSFPEHVTFPSVSAFKMWGDRHELQAKIVARVRYRPLPIWKKPVYLMQMCVFLISPTLLNAVGRFIDHIRAAPHPRRQLYSPGAPGVFTDHHVVAFTRPAR